MPLRPGHGWQARDDEQRCASTELRWVNGTHGEPARLRRVRCTLPRGHAEDPALPTECRWRNRRFGYWSEPDLRHAEASS